MLHSLIDNISIMSLITEVLEKIRLLLDKPISPLTRTQIIDLVNKQVAPADDILVLFTKKYRADLLQHIINLQPITLDKLQFLLAVMVEKLLQFKPQEASLLWKAILSKAELKNVRQLWTEKLLKEALKNSNQALKVAQLELLKENSIMLWQWNEGRIFQEFTKNFCKAFTKFNIYLSPYPLILAVLLSKAQNVQTNLIDNQIRQELLSRLIEFLSITKSKQLFLFQNQCLKTCSVLLLSKKTHLNDLIQLYACDKILEEYLWKKPTRQEAYACKLAVKKVRELIDSENRDKMQRNYSSKESGPQKPILIQETIEKANIYRKNNRLMIDQSQVKVKQQNSNYLKRGVGNGGGKSMIMSSPQKRIKGTDLDELVQSCFRSSQSQLAVRIQKQDRVQQIEAQASMCASTITVQEDKDFQQISNLIDLAYQFKFDIKANE